MTLQLIQGYRQVSTFGTEIKRDINGNIVIIDYNVGLTIKDKNTDTILVDYEPAVNSVTLPITLDSQNYILVVIAYFDSVTQKWYSNVYKYPPDGGEAVWWINWDNANIWVIETDHADNVLIGTAYDEYVEATNYTRPVGVLYKYAANGDFLWSTEIGNQISKIYVCPDNSILVTTQTESYEYTALAKLMKITPDGLISWSLIIPSDNTNYTYDIFDVAIDKNGEVYCIYQSSINGYYVVSRINKDTGEQIWYSELTYGGKSLAVNEDGYIYVLDDIMIRKYTPDGAQIWEDYGYLLQPDIDPYNGTVSAFDGCIYVSNYGDILISGTFDTTTAGKTYGVLRVWDDDYGPFGGGGGPSLYVKEGTWQTGTLKVKSNGNWVDPVATYVKANGAWTQT